MGDADQAALLANGGDRLQGRETGRHELLDEDALQIAVGGLDFLADDDGQPVRRGVAGTQRPVDPVVVRDRQVRQAAGQRPPGPRRREWPASRSSRWCGSAGR